MAATAEEAEERRKSISLLLVGAYPLAFCLGNVYSVLR